MLLTRAPLYSRSEDHFRVRLACVRHTASVRSEPGSNSPVIFLKFCPILFNILEPLQALLTSAI